MQLLLDMKSHAEKIILDHDVKVPMRDGSSIMANVFRPQKPGTYPVLMTFGPYGKDIHFSENSPGPWEDLTRNHPEVFEESSGKYMAFETPDPEAWVPHGYVVIRVDSRGAAKSPGKLDANSPAEFQDFYDAIEWAGVQPWSNGKVGLIGISYYACSQWYVASLRPPHLAAILPWQGTYDFYRGRTRQGGLFCSGFVQRWWNNVCRKQHGNAASPFKDMFTGGGITGPLPLSEAERRANREEYVDNVLAHPLLDEWYAARSGDMSKINIPAFVVANFGGLGLHLRGTIEGWRWITSPDKWLKIQRGSYFVSFFMPKNVALQRKFFDRYLKGVDNGWEKEPSVEVEVRSMDDGIARTLRDTHYPLSTTRAEKYYLDAATKSLTLSAPTSDASATCPAMSSGLTFRTAPFERDVEIAGPIKAHLFMASSTPDMDVFATLRAWGPDGREATFFASDEPAFPVSMGWLRCTHRKLDATRSTEWIPYHSHDEYQPLTPGEIYELDIEIWAASLALPKGSRLTLSIAGRDFEREGATGIHKGSGPFVHADPIDRPPEKFSGEQAIHSGPGRLSYVQLPIIS
ncbi:MAG: CocE/NonD family hydrolase [Burkholderiales bacterium]